MRWHVHMELQSIPDIEESIGATADIFLPRFLEISSASGPYWGRRALLYSTLIYMERYRRGGAENL